MLYPDTPDTQEAAQTLALCACSKQELAARILALEQGEARARAELGATQAELARALYERDHFEALYRERCRRTAQEPLFGGAAPAPRPAPDLAHLEALGEVWARKNEIIEAAAKRAKERTARATQAGTKNKDAAAQNTGAKVQP